MLDEDIDSATTQFTNRVDDLRGHWWRLYKRYMHLMKINGNCALWSVYVHTYNLIVDDLKTYDFSSRDWGEALRGMATWKKLEVFVIP